MCKVSLAHGYTIIGEQNIRDWEEHSGLYNAYSSQPTERRRWWLPKNKDEQEQLEDEADAEFQAELAALAAEIDIDELVEYGKRLCMNCMTDECVCKDFLSFFTVDDRAVALFPYPQYLDGGGCKKCVFQYTAECSPYREFLKQWVDDKDATPDPLTKCKDFLPTITNNQ